MNDELRARVREELTKWLAIAVNDVNDDWSGPNIQVAAAVASVALALDKLKPPGEDVCQST